MGIGEGSTAAERLLGELPDVPRWVETRGMLRSPHVTVSGSGTTAEGAVVRLVHGAISAVAVVGCPDAAAIVAAVDGVTALTPVMAQSDNVQCVERALLGAPLSAGGRNWQRERAILHRLTSSPELPPVDASTAIRLLTRDDWLDHLPPGLRHEMTHARELAPVATAVDAGRPVSFCYPVWTTESMWDVSIDTLETHRGRGLAAHVVRFMIAHMRREGREPLWGALESNESSLRLAARLGFTPVDEILTFSRGGWVFLSGGFNG